MPTERPAYGLYKRCAGCKNKGETGGCLLESSLSLFRKSADMLAYPSLYGLTPVGQKMYVEAHAEDLIKLNGNSERAANRCPLIAREGDLCRDDSVGVQFSRNNWLKDVMSSEWTDIKISPEDAGECLAGLHPLLRKGLITITGKGGAVNLEDLFKRASVVARAAGRQERIAAILGEEEIVRAIDIRLNKSSKDWVLGLAFYGIAGNTCVQTHYSMDQSILWGYTKAEVENGFLFDVVVDKSKEIPKMQASYGRDVVAKFIEEGDVGVTMLEVTIGEVKVNLPLNFVPQLSGEQQKRYLKRR